MKKRVLAIVTVFSMLMCFCSVTALAYTDKKLHFSIEEPSGFTVINAENVISQQDFLQKINYTASGFKDYLSKNNIVFYAINKQNGNEIVLKCVSSEFSKNVVDLYLLDTDALEDVAQKIIVGKDYSVCEKNGNKFFEIAINSQDRSGEFFGTQYLTVKNGYLYSLSITFQSNIDTTDAENIANTVFNNFYIEDNNGFSWSKFGDIIITVIISIAILLFLVVAGYVVYTFINDIRTKNSSNDVAPYVKIKRRKF